MVSVTLSEHPLQGDVFVDKMVFQRGGGVRDREQHDNPGEPQVDIAGEIRLFARAAHQSRYFKQPEDGNWFALGGGNQIAADEDRKQDQIEHHMHRDGAVMRESRVTGKRRWRWRDKAPDHAHQQENKQNDADAFMNFGSLVIPDIVITERYHPQPERKHAINRQRHQPVKQYREMSISSW